MINIKEIAEQAASEFGLSLLDDRQIWDAENPPSAEQVKMACFAAASDNARSAIHRALGKLVEPLTQDLDVALAEDGPLVDFDTVVGMYIADAQLNLDSFAEALDWETKLDAVRKALGSLAGLYQPKPLTVAQLLAYANSDLRLHADGLRKAIAALVYPGAADVLAEADAPALPAFLKREKAPPKPRAPLPVTVITEAVNWGDGEDENLWDEVSPPAKASTTPPAVKPTSAPRLCTLAAAAGVPDQDMASLLNVSRSYYSLIRNGRRPWNGMKPDRVASLRVELHSRKEIIDELLTALESDTITKAEEV